jgi:hypothetical protein
MTLHRVLALASVLALAGVSDAVAQFPPVPGQQTSQQPSQASPFPPPPGQSSPFPASPGQSSPFPASPGQASPFPTPGQSGPVSRPGQTAFPQPGGANPCEAFVPLRQDAEKGAAAIRAASERKATREEVCPLFQKFSAAEGKKVKFLETHKTACGIPADAIQQGKTNHARTVAMRNQVCSPSAGPRVPSLSDTLGSPTTPTEAPKPGRGTFDTLTGPLQR